MPITTCSLDGKDGFKYGDQGTCYTHDGTPDGMKAAKAKAVKQALAIGGGKAPTDLSEVDLADAGTKTCATCGNSKSTASFPEDKRTKDGYGAECASCRFKSNHTEREFADLLQTVDIPDVPILSTGGPFKGSGSAEDGDFFKPEQLQAIETANRELGSEVRVPIKLGHNRNQKLLKNSGLFTDEQPAAGWVENIRYRAADGKLVGDLKRVPRKLAELLKVGAFRTRSVELSRVTSQSQTRLSDDGKTHVPGKTYDSVITGLALLGAKAPAVKTLDDIWALYADDLDATEERFAEGISAQPVEYHTYSDSEPLLPVEEFSWPAADVLTEAIKLELAAVKESRATADTKGMSESNTVVADPKGLTDDQIAKFAEAFGIEEADAKARRDKVLEKFSEFAGSPEPTPTPTPSEPSTPEPSTPASEPQASAEVTALAERLDAMETKAKKDRVLANVDAAIKTCRLTPAERDRFIAFGERDPDLLVETLVKLPVRTDLLLAYGDDGEGETGNKSQDDLYAAYAAQTGVATVVTGGNA